MPRAQGEAGVDPCRDPEREGQDVRRVRSTRGGRPDDSNREARKEDGNDEEDGKEESGAEETRRGPAARKNDDDREEDEGAGVVTSKKAAAVSAASKTKMGKSRRRDSHAHPADPGGACSPWTRRAGDFPRAF